MGVLATYKTRAAAILYNLDVLENDADTDDIARTDAQHARELFPVTNGLLRALSEDHVVILTDLGNQGIRNMLHFTIGALDDRSERQIESKLDVYITRQAEIAADMGIHRSYQDFADMLSCAGMGSGTSRKLYETYLNTVKSYLPSYTADPLAQWEIDLLNDCKIDR